MSIEKLYEKIPTKEGRTFVGLFLIVLGLVSSAALLTVIFIPLGIAILAFDYEWARNILRWVRDTLTALREKFENRPSDRQEG